MVTEMGVGAIGLSATYAAAARAMAQGQAQAIEGGEALARTLEPTAAVAMKLGQHQLEAGVAVAKTADELTGTLVDLLA